jgi:glucan phosphoethanolaminetransferase (alkaline phosphatase superfamily)
MENMQNPEAWSRIQRWRLLIASISNYALNLIVLAIPLGVILVHCFSQQIGEALTHGRLAAVASEVVVTLDQEFYAILLWTTLGVIATFRFEFSKRFLWIAGLLIAVMAMLSSLVAGAAGEIGSDSLGEVLRANWSEAVSYCQQSIETFGINRKQFLAVSAVIFFFLAVNVLAKIKIYRPSTTLGKLSVTIAFVSLIGCLCVDVLSLLQNQSSFSTYRQNLQTGTHNESANFKHDSSAPLVLVYIGESTNRSWLYRELKQQIQGTDLDKNLVLFSDVVSPASHTYLSLFRALSVSSDPARDQLTNDQELLRPNLISVLNENGATTVWYSNQPGNDWVGALFGHEAIEEYFSDKDAGGRNASLRKKDHEVLPNLIERLKSSHSKRWVGFFHSYAGHFDYCDNIPETSVARVSDPIATLPFTAVYGDMSVFSHDMQQRKVNCYRNAMAYVANNIEFTMQALSRFDSPAVLIYFSDHGEDVLEGTAHDSGRPSFRKIEVPFAVYFNDAAKREYGKKFESAVDNKDAKYSLEWAADSIMDIAGVSYNRPMLSIFQPIKNPPVRYSSLRYYRGKQFVIAVDGDDKSRGNVEKTNIDLYAKRQLIQSLPSDQQGKICAHRSDSYLKFSDAAEAFSCFEVDLVIEPQMKEVYVYHPPKKNSGLTLGSLLALQPERFSGIWLDVKNAQQPTLEFLLEYLNRWFPSGKRSSVLVEVSLSETESDALKEVLFRIRQNGYGLSYYLPTDEGIQCSTNPETPDCTKLRKTVEGILRRVPYSSLSFDVRAKRFAISIDKPSGVEMNTWDVTVKKAADLDRDMLQRTTKYLIPYVSRFEY